MKSNIAVQNHEVSNRLAEIAELEEQALLDVVRKGFLAYANCTPNHPPIAAGIWAWAETVRYLRECLVPEGWRKSDTKNYSRVIHPASKISIAVMTGDKNTGRVESSPSNKIAKGPTTCKAVSSNQEVFSFIKEEFDEKSPPQEEEDGLITWILLVHRAPSEVRCELSLPESIGPNGFIDQWRERIILGRIPTHSDTIDDVPVELEDIEVTVLKRK